MNINTPHNNCNSAISFNGLLYGRGSEKFIAKLDKNAVKVLKKAEEDLEFTRFWDVEVGEAGLKILSRDRKKAYYASDSVINPPAKNTIKIDAKNAFNLYRVPDAYNVIINLKYSDSADALLAYGRLKYYKGYERVIQITKELEQLDADKNYLCAIRKK